MKKLFVILAFIILLPLIATELVIKYPTKFMEQFKLSFQLMLFITSFGRKCKPAKI